MEMKPNRYTIRTVEDFFTIPQEKLKPFMLDFIEFLAIGFAVRDDDAFRMDRSHFTWIDDGNAGLSGVQIIHVQKATESVHGAEHEGEE